MLRQAKINMMAIIGMMVAMGTMSFTAKEKAARLLSPQWFQYTASDHPLNETEAKTAGNYTAVGTVDPDPGLCSGSADLCAIMAETDPSGPNDLPVIEGDIETAIEAFFQSSSSSTLLREKN